jgi:NADH dehydrogenase
MNVRAEPGTPTVLNKGTTLTMALPVRGNVQVRVEQVTPTQATLVTLSGHPLCGAIRFLAEQRADFLRFEVQVYDRPANIADWLAMRTVGDGLQAQTWEALVTAMVAESGGTATMSVQHEEVDLDPDQAERVETWVKEVVVERKRSRQSRPTGGRAAAVGSDALGTEASL